MWTLREGSVLKMGLSTIVRETAECPYSPFSRTLMVLVPPPLVVAEDDAAPPPLATPTFGLG